MVLRRCDRYVLREMIGPFLLSLFGLLLFILLNLILSLSDLMVDRGVGVLSLLRLLVLKMPSLFVLALPLSGLFATFIGLGRLVHDREVIALQAAGISLRRVLTPLLVAAFLLGVFDFALSNWAVPSSEHSYQRVLRGIIFREGVPHIRSNTFFKGPEDQFFYVRRYDEKDGTLRGILIYDVEGKVFPQAKAAVTILTAEEGRWREDAWDLSAGRVYGYAQKGELIYTGTFEELRVGIDRTGADLVMGSRTPAEMGIGELRSRIALLRASGLPVDDLVVECHLKAAIPFATLVFVLFGGSASLLFGWRSRALGVVVSFLLVGLFQGTLLWSQTLGRRGVLPASFAAWIPDLLFGLVGVFLFLQLDRLRRGGTGRGIRRAFPFLAIFLFGFVAIADRVPVAIDCETLSISSDRDHVTASGAVRVSYGETRLQADGVTLDRGDEGAWQLAATGEVELRVGEDLTLSGERLAARLQDRGEGVIAQEATATSFRGRSLFTNSRGEEHVLLYGGEEGRIEFDTKGNVASIEVSRAELSTCECCGGALRAQPYSIATGRLLVYPDRLIVAFDLVVRAAGIPVFWLPVYVQPLKETQESPLFPSVGEDALRGFFLKWNLPFYLGETNYGAVLVDYFSRFQELGLGLVLRYATGAHMGKVRVYSLPARVGNSVLEVSLDHSVTLAQGWEVGGRLAYDEVGSSRRLSYSFTLSGSSQQGWKLALAAERTQSEDEEGVRAVERLPELMLSHAALTLGPVSFLPRLTAGWLREWQDDTLVSQSLRLDGSLGANLPSVSLLGFTTTETAGFRLTLYEVAGKSQSREAFSLSASLDSPTLSFGYSYQLVSGGSPFSFDSLVSSSRLTWCFRGDAGAALAVDGGFDLVSGVPDPLVVSLRWGKTLSFDLVARCNLATGTVEKVTLNGRWEAVGADAMWIVPFLPSHGRFDVMTFQVHAKTDAAEVSCRGEIDPAEGRLSRATLRAELRSETGWGITASGDYTYAGGLTPSVGIFRDLYNCLRLGIERKAGQFWIYGSVLAFPEAVLRYAPTGAGLQVGG